MLNVRRLHFKKSAILALFFLLNSSLYSVAFDENATIKNPVLVQSGIERNWGALSGEDLLKHYRTNHIVTLANGTQKQYVSLRFLAKDWDNIVEQIISIKVVDAKTQKLIDAQKAFYVINSKASTSFTKFSKIAFEKKEDAQEFIKKYKGNIRPFDFALYVATRDIQEDEKLTKEKRAKDYKRGSKIYELVCDEIDPNKFQSISLLKKHIATNKVCVDLNERDLQDLALYLFDIKRFGELKVFGSQISVPKESKCPVCGMFVAKYPKWVGLIKHNGDDFYFDGAKDLFKFYFDPKRYFYNDGATKDFSEVYVTDYYSLQQLNAKEAWYVIGSNVYGPMGHELIPFVSKQKAQEFFNEHDGEVIISFDEITNEKVWALDQ